MITTLLYVLAALGLLTVLRIVAGWITPSPAARLPTSLSARPGETSPGLSLDAVASHLHSPILDGNRVELLVNGDRIFPAMLEAVEAARESVDFLTYVYWRGDIAREMADALARAAERGVIVRVLLDAYGSLPMDSRLVERLERAGAQVARFHPIRWYTLRRLNNRTHRKVMVVDGRVGFTGGVGIAAEWEGDARTRDEWRDDHFRIRGPAVAFLQGAFADNWRVATGELLEGDALFPDPVPAGGARVVPLITGPGGKVSKVALVYWWALRSARDRVDIATPYFLPSHELARAICETSARGVRVRLIVPGSQNDSRLLRLASLCRYPELLEHGVELHEFETSMFHAKAMTVDGRWAVIGSANFDNRSFELNDEVTLVVEDPDLVGALDASFERDLTGARRVTSEAVSRRSVWVRAKSRAAHLLRRQL